MSLKLQKRPQGPRISQTDFVSLEPFASASPKSPKPGRKDLPRCGQLQERQAPAEESGRWNGFGLGLPGKTREMLLRYV